MGMAVVSFMYHYHSVIFYPCLIFDTELCKKADFSLLIKTKLRLGHLYMLVCLLKIL